MAKIIIIDDEPHLVKILSKLLSDLDHHVTGVDKSARAKELLMSEDYDIMISDVRMKPINGVELLKLARKQHPKMPVIMITAYHTEKLSAETKNEGAFAYFPKPFQINDIFNAINQAVEAKT